jgi:hypothetical protein
MATIYLFPEWVLYLLMVVGGSESPQLILVSEIVQKQASFALPEGHSFGTPAESACFRGPHLVGPALWCLCYCQCEVV